MTGKEAAQWVEPYPSLSGGTIAIWYRACCEQLQVGAWVVEPAWGRRWVMHVKQTPLPGLCTLGVAECG